MIKVISKTLAVIHHRHIVNDDSWFILDSIATLFPEGTWVEVTSYNDNIANPTRSIYHGGIVEVQRYKHINNAYQIVHFIASTTRRTIPTTVERLMLFTRELVGEVRP